VVAAGALADHRERLAAAGRAGGEEPDGDGDAGMQIGIAVVA